MLFKPRKPRTPLGGFSTKLVFSCDQCGVLFARGRAAKKAADKTGQKHEFCSVDCYHKFARTNPTQVSP